MAKVKKLNASYFAELQKELTAIIESIRARQDEKQALFDEFDSECKRFFFGKISERALASSVKKTNKEKQRLDKAIKIAIKQAKKISGKETRLCSIQAPKTFQVSLTGVKAIKHKRQKKRLISKKRIIKKKRKK